MRRPRKKSAPPGGKKKSRPRELYSKNRPLQAPERNPAALAGKVHPPAEKVTHTMPELTDAVRRERVRARLANGSLPRERAWTASETSTTGGTPPNAVTVVQGHGERCSGCDTPINEAYAPFSDVAGNRMIRFHDACERIWEDERRRPKKPEGN